MTRTKLEITKPIKTELEIDLKNEIATLNHYILLALKNPHLDDLQFAVELSKNKTMLAQKEFSLLELVYNKKRLALYEQEKESLELQEDLILSNIYDFPYQDFFRKRIPNPMESTINCLPKSFLELFISDELRNSPNPTVKGFVRDLTKIPSAFISWYKQQQIGSTEYVFDDFSLAGTLIKSGCKISIIFGTTAMMGGPEYVSASLLSRASNYICEAPSRILTSISRKHQKAFSAEERNSQTAQEKLEFLYKHLTYDLVQGSVYAGITKTITTDTLGTALGVMSQEGFWDKNREQSFYTLFTSKIFERKVENYEGGAHLIDKGIDLLRDYISDNVLSLSEPDSFIPENTFNHIIEALKTNTLKFIKQTTKSLFDTYTLTPPARIVEDGTLIIKNSAAAKYLPNKVLHLLDNMVDTKTEQGFASFLFHNHTRTQMSATPVEEVSEVFSEELGAIGAQHDEL